MVLKVVLVLVSFPCIVLGAVSPCSSGEFPLNIRNNICDINAERCKIQTKTPIQFELDFLAPTSSNTLIPSVTGFWGAISIPIPLSDDELDACKNIVDTGNQSKGCPIIVGEYYTYKMNLVIETLPASNLNVDVQVALRGDSGILTCFMFPARI